MRDPANSARVRAEVRAVAEEIAADPRYGDEDSSGRTKTPATASASSPSGSSATSLRHALPVRRLSTDGLAHAHNEPP